MEENPGLGLFGFLRNLVYSSPSEHQPVGLQSRLRCEEGTTVFGEYVPNDRQDFECKAVGDLLDVKEPPDL